jgi:hypothetical protein
MKRINDQLSTKTHLACTILAQDTLENVRTWIDENRTDGDQPYKLLAQFPTRHFSTGDEQKTLQSLDLVPSSTIT